MYIPLQLVSLKSRLARVRMFGTIAVALVAGHWAAAQMILHVGEIGEYRFHFTAPPTSSHGPVNFLAYTGGVGWSGDIELQVSLYDGAQLLGSRLLARPSFFMRFSAFGSPALIGSTIVNEFIDFSSVLDGTIDGRLTVQAFQAQPLFVNAPIHINWAPYTGYQETGSGGFWGGPNAVVDSFSVRPISSVPEPATYGMVFGFAALLFGLFRRFRSTPR